MKIVVLETRFLDVQDVLASTLAKDVAKRKFGESLPGLQTALAEDKRARSRW